MRLEDYQTGKTIISSGYHWVNAPFDGLEKAKLTNRKPLYFCDNDHSWFQPEVTGQKLYEIEFMIHNPLVILEQFATYETIFDSTHHLKEYLKHNSFDAIIFTPHLHARGYRQGVLLRPKDQILSIQPMFVGENDQAYLKKRKAEDTKHWTEFMEENYGPLMEQVKTIKSQKQVTKEKRKKHFEHLDKK